MEIHSDFKEATESVGWDSVEQHPDNDRATYLRFNLVFPWPSDQSTSISPRSSLSSPTCILHSLPFLWFKSNKVFISTSICPIF